MNWFLTHWWQLGIVMAFLVVAGFLLVNIRAYENRKGPDHPPPPPTPTIPPVNKNEPRRWYIPQPHILEVLELWDNFDEDNTCGRYLFWKKISEILPETNGLNIEFDPDEDVLKPCIKEDK